MSRDAVEVETGANPTAAVIWLHGLGADGHDFEPIVPELVRPGERALRFVFPHAPIRPVTLNGGFAMRAWYDITSLERMGPQDEAGIRASQASVETLIQRENARGIATSRIVIAGFSQGGRLFRGVAQLPDASQRLSPGGRRHRTVAAKGAIASIARERDVPVAPRFLNQCEWSSRCCSRPCGRSLPRPCSGRPCSGRPAGCPRGCCGYSFARGC